MADNLSTPAPATAPVAASEATGSEPSVNKPASNHVSAKPTATPSADGNSYDVKIDGKVVKMSLQELMDKASLGTVAHKRFQEASALKTEADQKLKKLSTPKDAIRFLMNEAGFTRDEAIAEFENYYAENVIARNQMTPEQRDLADAKARLQKYEEKEAADAAEAKAKEAEGLTKAMVAQITQDIIKVIETSNLPRTEFARERVAHWMKVNVLKGIDAPVELIVQQVQGEIRSQMRKISEASSAQQIIDYLGPEAVKKLREHDIAEIRKNRAAKNQPAPAPKEGSRKTQENSDEWGSMSRKLYGKWSRE